MPASDTDHGHDDNVASEKGREIVGFGKGRERVVVGGSKRRRRRIVVWKEKMPGSMPE